MEVEGGGCADLDFPSSESWCVSSEDLMFSSTLHHTPLPHSVNAPHLEEVVSILLTLNPNRLSFVYVQVVSIDVSDRL